MKILNEEQVSDIKAVSRQLVTLAILTWIGLLGVLVIFVVPSLFAYEILQALK